MFLAGQLRNSKLVFQVLTGAQRLDLQRCWENNTPPQGSQQPLMAGRIPEGLVSKVGTRLVLETLSPNTPS